MSVLMMARMFRLALGSSSRRSWPFGWRISPTTMGAASADRGAPIS